MVINRCKCSGVIKQNIFLFVCKAIHERIQQNIKAKPKIPILYCTTNQLIEVKVSFAFGYRIGSAGKYLVPKMHLTQLKIINSMINSIRVIYFQEAVFVMKRGSCITSITHAGKRYCGMQFFGGKFTPRFSTSLTWPAVYNTTKIRHRSKGWSCYRGSTVCKCRQYLVIVKGISPSPWSHHEDLSMHGWNLALTNHVNPTGIPVGHRGCYITGFRCGDVSSLVSRRNTWQFSNVIVE
jgi:hypothetical protein